MARLRFIGPNPVQLPTPFGFVVSHGDVIEVPEHQLPQLRQSNVSNVFAATPSGSVRMPSAEHWQLAEEPVGEGSVVDEAGEEARAFSTDEEDEPQRGRRARHTA